MFSNWLEITYMMILVLGIYIPYMTLYIYFWFYLSVKNPRWPLQQDKGKQRTIFSQKLQSWFNPNCTLIIAGWFLTKFTFFYWFENPRWPGMFLWSWWLFSTNCMFFINYEFKMATGHNLTLIFMGMYIVLFLWN